MQVSNSLCRNGEIFKGAAWSERVVSIITAQVGWNVSVRVAGNVWIGVDPCSGRAPVLSSGSKEIGRGDWHGWRMRGHKVDLLLVGVIGRHVS